MVAIGHATRRRIVPIVGAYLAGGWGLLQFVSWASDRYTVSSVIVDSFTGLWLSFIPVIAYFAWRQPGDEPDVSTPIAADAASIAVLPFANGDAEDVFLSDGISDEIITVLGRVEGLRVSARSSSFAFRDRKLDARQVGRALKVKNILEGSVRHSGQRLRVAAQLVNADDGFQLWAGQWDAEMSDVFAIEEQIANNVAAALSGVFGVAKGGAPPQVPRADLKAYEQYLRGRRFYRETKKRSLRYARDLFRHAIEHDPEYATAHAALADSITLERMYYPASDADLAEADRASRRALELDPNLAEAHSARACVLFLLRRFDEAESEFKAAVRLNPQLFEAWYFYARMCFQQGRMEEAVQLFKRASSVQEDYQAAFFTAQSLEALDGSNDAVAAYETALQVIESYMELNPDDARAATMRSTALCRIGRTAEGVDWAERAVEIDPADAGVRYNVSCTLAVAGEKEKALACLEDAVRGGFGNRDWLRNDPDLASLRGDARFESLMATM
ncbi:MAG TPA: tetratricopeptide repeat protein [Longimicrobiales bacterium]